MAASHRVVPPRLPSLVPAIGCRRWTAPLVSALAVGTGLLLAVGCLAKRAHAADSVVPRRIYIANADGTDWTLMSEALDEYDRQGSPDWSQDGKRITIDAWREGKGENYADAQIIVVNADGSNPRALIDGAVPSFSPGGHRIVFSRYAPNRGVWVMNSEGPEKGLALIDEAGLKAGWSPDGRNIAYTKFTNQGANLVIFNVIEGTRRLVFKEKPSPFSQIYWNFAWSPDSERIIFGARQGKKYVVAIVDVRGAKHGLVTRLPVHFRTSYSWRPDGKRILFCKNHKKRGCFQLFLLDPETTAAPKRLPGQNPNWRYFDSSYSPDGAKIAVSVKKICTPIPGSLP